MAEIFKRVNGRKITKVIAMHADVQRRVDAIADEKAVEAKALYDQRRASGTGDSYITVDKGDVDAYVVLDDTRGLDAALSIEFGRQPNEEGKGGMRGLFVLHDVFHLRKR